MRQTYLALLFVCLCCSAQIADVVPAIQTEPVSDDPDDPAVWINSADPSSSLIIGTNKVAAPAGALVVFGLDGKKRQTIAGIDRPNNVDVEYGLQAGSAFVDIAVATERNKSRLRAFRVASTGLEELSGSEGLRVFAGETAERAAPMGIALYKRPRDGAIFAIVGRKTGPRQGYLWQYRLQTGPGGTISMRKVREFGYFSGTGEIEAIAVDDALGYVYYADEGDGIHKWHADPDHPSAGRELAHFAKTGFRGDREGIAIYALNDGTGYIVCADQIPGNTEYHVFPREGTAANPHEHRELKIFRGGADETDGIEIVSTALGARFPDGLMVAMNSGPKNFLYFRWRDIANAGPVRLRSR